MIGSGGGGVDYGERGYSEVYPGQALCTCVLKLCFVMLLKWFRYLAK